MLGARTRDSGSASHRICDIFALLNAKSEATSTGWLLEPPLESALRRGTSNLATSAEPNELATNSRSFWLAARCPGLAGNGQYCGETVALWYGNIAHRSKPDAPLNHSWATFSVSPTGRALLVNGSAGTSFLLLEKPDKPDNSPLTH